MNSVSSKVLRRIRAKGRGWVFTAKDFLDLGTRNNVDQVLYRLTRQNKIRKIDRGIYDLPKTHPLLGTLSPDPDSLARVIAAQTGNFIQPSGARAANWLGISTQVPAKPVYLTTGPSQRRKVGGYVIKFKHTSITPPDNINSMASMTLQALLYLGKDQIDDKVLFTCSSQLSSKDKSQLTSMSNQVPSWMTDVIHKLKDAQNGQDS